MDDRHLTTREETDAFMSEYGVKTTPQTFIGGERVGGFDDLRRLFGKSVKDPHAVTYKPVTAIFAMGAALAMAVSWLISGAVLNLMTAELFISITMCLLAPQKLRDVETFSTMFLGYDLLAQQSVPYAYLHPFGEAAAGILMTAHALNWLSVPIALVIGGIGAVSVFYAVYVQKRELKCACVGADSNVPLGFLSLAENVMMFSMALWMLFAYGLRSSEGQRPMTTSRSGIWSRSYAIWPGCQSSMAQWSNAKKSGRARGPLRNQATTGLLAPSIVMSIEEYS